MTTLRIGEHRAPKHPRDLPEPYWKSIAASLGIIAFGISVNVIAWVCG